MRSWRVDVTGKTPREAVEAALPPDTAQDLCCIILTGETGRGRRRCRELAGGAGGPVLRPGGQDRTRVAEDIWARAEEVPSGGCFAGAEAEAVGGPKR